MNAPTTRTSRPAPSAGSKKPATQQGSTTAPVTPPVDVAEPPTKPIPDITPQTQKTKADLNEGAKVIRTAAAKAATDKVDNLEDIHKIVKVHRDLAAEFEDKGDVPHKELTVYKAIITLLQEYIDGEIISIKNNLVALEKRILTVDENSIARDQVLATAIVATNNRIGKTPVGQTLGVLTVVGIIAGLVVFGVSNNIVLAFALGAAFGLAAGAIFLLFHSRSKELDSTQTTQQMQQSINNLPAVTTGSPKK